MIIMSSDNKNTGSDNKKKSTANRKAEDGTFRSKNVKHDPRSESSRAVFGLRGDKKERQPNAGRDYEEQ